MRTPISFAQLPLTALSLFVLLFTEHTSATPLLFNFTGTYSGGSLTGSIAFNPDEQPITQETANFKWQQDLSGQYFQTTYHQPYISMSLTLPGGLTLTNSGTFMSQSETMIARSYGGNSDFWRVTVSSRDEIYKDGYQLYQNYFWFHLNLDDNITDGSSLFLDSNAGLSYAQPLNLGIASQDNAFSYINMDVVNGEAVYTEYHYGSFTIDSLTLVKAVPEPESLTLVLAGLGLIGAITRRRKAAIN